MNSTSSNFSVLTMDSEFLASVGSVIMSTRYELLLFATAVAAHFLLFGNANPQRRLRQHSRKEKPQEASFPTGASAQRPASHGHLSEMIQAAARAGDHRQVLRCWTEAKRSKEVSEIPLDKVIESMQRFKKDSSSILAELRDFLKRRCLNDDGSCMDLVNDLLESMSKRMDLILMEQTIAMLPQVGLAPDQRTYDALLSAFFMCRSFTDVQRVVTTMKAKSIPLNTRALVMVIKTALKTNRLDDATAYFRELKATWGPEGPTSGSPSIAPRQVAMQILELACKEGRLAEFLPELEGVPLTEQTVQMMLGEGLRQHDTGLIKRVESWARAQNVPLSDASFTLLVKGLSSEPARVEELLEELIAKGTDLSTDFVLAMVNFCGHSGNMSLANRVFQCAKPRQPVTLSAFIRLYVNAGEFDRACDIYEGASASADSPQQLVLDARAERNLMNAALRSGRSQLAQLLLDASPSDVAKHITMIRNCAAENNLEGATSIFESLKQRGTPLNSIVYNAVLDACVECRNLQKAEAWMQEMKQAGMADVVSYNTLIKAHLHTEAFEQARTLMEEMRLAGFQPNRVTFNELVNAMVAKGCPIWGVLDEMKAADLQPNQVTCSILLKNLNHDSNDADILKTMDMIGSMEEPMDEVLLSSVVEACVRIGKPDLLTSKLKQLRGGEGVTITGSHTFGSLIKAYGRAGDINGVWSCWKEMRSRHVRPTSVTLGCMVEAVVSNGDAEGAYDLVHQMRADEQCSGALNAVIYCSVLKGFAREKRLERVWAVYDEMKSQGLESIVTYNTIIDACTRCGRMDQVPEVLETMRKAKTEPNIITYSTVLKGHAQSGNIREAFTVLDRMRRETNLKPDEVMYNSLLDGCAQQGLVDEGLYLLEQMQGEGVRPSNFTLSVLVKLFSRLRKVDRAFRMVREISAKYRIRPNVHVHTNLIQACITNRQLTKALGSFEQMLEEGVRPSERTYNILFRACISSGQFETSVGLLRAALDLDRAPPALARLRSVAACHLDGTLVSQMLTQLAEGCPSPNLVAELLTQIRYRRQDIRISTATQAKVVWHSSSSVSPAAVSVPRPPCSGKGGGRSRA